MALALMLILMAEPVWATGLGETSPCVARNALELYCINHGGCPRDGNCYFPDGGYCDLRSFYNGTCPGREYYEQAIWMSEAYRFLNGDEGYLPAYMPYGGQYYPLAGYPSYNYYYWPGYSP
jgi:hypothetical protein